jgi:hypothetical protein
VFAKRDFAAIPSGEASGRRGTEVAMRIGMQAAARMHGRVGSGGAVSTHVAVPLLVGVSIYALWRPLELRWVGWLDPGSMLGWLATAREAAAAVRPAIPDWLLFNLPDALWTYALTSCLALVWKRERSAVRAAWIASALALSVGLELAQRAGWVAGTFDGADVVASAAAWAVAVVMQGNARRT